jgi:hypothetical protein
MGERIRLWKKCWDIAVDAAEGVEVIYNFLCSICIYFFAEYFSLYIRRKMTAQMKRLTGKLMRLSASM